MADIIGAGEWETKRRSDEAQICQGLEDIDASK